MNEKTILKLTKWLIFPGLIGIAITVCIYFFQGHINFNDIDNDTIGTFGDFIGGFIGTVVAIATTLLILVTYTSQKKELHQTGELLKKQRFEDTFFNLLQVQQQIRKSISFESDKRLTWYENDPHHNIQVLSGDIFFEFAMEDFSRLYIKRPGLIRPAIIERAGDHITNLLNDVEEDIPMEEPERRIKSTYKKFFDNYHYQLGHYFRHLYYILKFIEENENEEMKNPSVDKKEVEIKYCFYAGIVQAQMSSPELYLMFYNGICFKQMNRMISKYNLIENLSEEDLADTEHHRNLYGENKLKTRRTMLD